MRSRILVSAFLLFAITGAGTLIARAAHACDACAYGTACDKACCADGTSCCGADHADGSCMNQSQGGCMKHAIPQAAASQMSRDQQWTVVNFRDTVRVAKAFVSGPVLIVHDDQKMARGEPCTTFYRFDPASGPKEALVSFHCKPRRTPAVDATTLKTLTSDAGAKQLVEYQIAGDSEAHGIPR